MEEEKADLSVIIVAYNSKADLQRLLPSVLESEGVAFVARPFMDNQTADKSARYSAEIIAVDNGSTDDTLESLSPFLGGRLKMGILKNLNNGFAKGNNLGIKQAQGKYILILNPDTELKPETLRTMIEFMENHPDIGISTCKVLLPNGKLDLACRRRFPNPWNSFLRLIGLSRVDYNMLDTDENQSQEIDACMGAFMMIRRIGKSDRSENRISDQSDSADFSGFPKFDEDFFMYGEDIDLCWRCKEAGYKVWYYPAVSIIHYKGSSSRKVSFKALKWFADAMWIFYRKHYKQRYPFFLNWLVWLGIYCRLLLLSLINLFRTDRFVSKR